MIVLRIQMKNKSKNEVLENLKKIRAECGIFADFDEDFFGLEVPAGFQIYSYLSDSGTYCDISTDGTMLKFFNSIGEILGSSYSMGGSCVSKHALIDAKQMIYTSGSNLFGTASYDYHLTIIALPH